MGMPKASMELGAVLLLLYSLEETEYVLRKNAIADIAEDLNRPQHVHRALIKFLVLDLGPGCHRSVHLTEERLGE